MALHYMFRRPIADIIDVFTLIVAEIEENGTLGVKDGLRHQPYLIVVRVLEIICLELLRYL